LVGSSDARRLALWATCLIGLLLAAPALIRWTTEKQTARLDAEITNLTAQLRLAEPAHKRAVILSKTDSALRAELLRPRLSQQLEQLAVTLDEKIWLREFAQTADMKRLSLHAKEADTVLAALSVQTVKPWRRIEHAAPGSLPDKDQQGRSLLVLQQEQVP
jgi:Tfp pilus assembly protein PilN